MHLAENGYVPKAGCALAAQRSDEPLRGERATYRAETDRGASVIERDVSAELRAGLPRGFDQRVRMHFVA